jgi:hypothetical protein
VRTRWKEYGPSVEEEETYVAVKKNTSGSRPKELFDDLIVVRLQDLTSTGLVLSFTGLCMALNVCHKLLLGRSDQAG